MRFLVSRLNHSAKLSSISPLLLTFLGGYTKNTPFYNEKNQKKSQKIVKNITTSPGQSERSIEPAPTEIPVENEQLSPDISPFPSFPSTNEINFESIFSSLSQPKRSLSIDPQSRITATPVKKYKTSALRSTIPTEITSVMGKTITKKSTGKKAAPVGIPIATPSTKIPVSQELINNLERDFSAAQANIKCPNDICKKKGKIIILDGANNPAFEPPTPIYKCTSCYKKYAHTRILDLITAAIQATKNNKVILGKEKITTSTGGSRTPTGTLNSDQEMDHVLHLQNQVTTPPTANQQEKSWADQVEDLTTEKQSVDMETNNNFLHLYPNLPDFLQDIYKKQETTDKKVSELTEALSNMAQIIKENATLKIELEAARAEIALLKNKQVTLDPTPSTKKALRPTIQILDNEDDGLAQSKHAPPPAQIQQQLKNNYAAAVTRGIKKQPIKKRSIPSKRAKEIAARHLTAVPESQGFQFMYVPCRHRMTIKAMRQILRTLRVDNSRILDVHFPDRQVAALLIHNDYAQSLTEILEKEGIQVKKEFDPLDPSILRDQKLADLTDEERFEKYKNYITKTCSKHSNLSARQSNLQ
ncbi:hypothetical protein BDC45DRAFT_562760 [Circinella umbellata]|nr:hypothetical protein BDC45DRAFT_562760 [Circinella umbellata]